MTVGGRGTPPARRTFYAGPTTAVCVSIGVLHLPIPPPLSPAKQSQFGRTMFQWFRTVRYRYARSPKINRIILLLLYVIVLLYYYFVLSNSLQGATTGVSRSFGNRLCFCLWIPKTNARLALVDDAALFARSSDGYGMNRRNNNRFP